jgi:hypothetical protein
MPTDKERLNWILGQLSVLDGTDNYLASADITFVGKQTQTFRQAIDSAMRKERKNENR